MKCLSYRGGLSAIVRHSLMGACIGAFTGFLVNLLGYAYDNLVHGVPSANETVVGIFLGIACVMGSLPLLLLVKQAAQHLLWLLPLNLALWGVAIGAALGWYRARKVRAGFERL
jgi:hypothetical protein